MIVNDLITMLTDGLDPAEAASVRKAIERDAVKVKVETLKQQSEYADLQGRMQTLQKELEGEGQPGQPTYKPGSKAYRDWYEKNYPTIQKLDSDLAAYKAKYGDLNNPTVTPPSPGVKTYTPEEIQTMVDNRIRDQYSPRWSDLLIGTGNLVQRHMLAGRKSPIDFTKVSALAQEKYNGNLDLAYEEWDKPERDRIAKEETDNLVNRRVEEELQKRQATSSFPAGADNTPGAMSQRSKADLDKYDPQALKSELVAEWNKAGQAAA
jgi:hypothetical protein